MESYILNLHKEPEGGYTVFVPALPGCITYGENVDEAISMAKEAIELYIEELHDRAETVCSCTSFIERVFSMFDILKQSIQLFKDN